MSSNVNVLAASFVSNSQSLSSNVNTLAAAFVSNSQSLSSNVNVLAANVNTLAGAYAGNAVSLSSNVNTLAAAFVSNSVSLSTAVISNNQSLSTNVNVLAAASTANTVSGRYLGTANNADLLDGLHSSAFLANTTGTSYNGNLYFPTGKVGIGNTNPSLKLEVAGNMSIDAFVECAANISTSYTITTGRNAMSAGPITLNSGVTITVPSGSTWTVT